MLARVRESLQKRPTQVEARHSMDTHWHESSSRGQLATSALEVCVHACRRCGYVSKAWVCRRICMHVCTEGCVYVEGCICVSREGYMCVEECVICVCTCCVCVCAGMLSASPAKPLRPAWVRHLFPLPRVRLLRGESI